MFRRGQTFKDTYRIEKELSGSKLSFLAVHLGLDTKVVVELFNDETGVEELDYDQRLERKRETLKRQDRLRRLAAVSHPHLAKVLDSFEHEEKLFLVREWVDGYTLRDLVAESLKPLSQKTAEGFRDQLFSLLDELQEKEPPLICGTLCPDYLVVGPDGDLKLVDYALGEHAPGKTEFEPFSCPEALGSGELDLRADLYSVGAILFYCVSGKELPPVWDRISHQQSIPTALELEVQVDSRFWSALESLLSLSLEKRPESLEGARELFETGEIENDPSSSPSTWYPEQSGLMLADSYPFAPFVKHDWILKMVQAAVAGRARGLAVVQTRENCRLDFQLAAPDVPSPQVILSALSSDAPIPVPMVADLACGLRIVGEFRDFRLTLDDWRHSWTLSCRGGKMSSRTGPSQGRSGAYLELDYEGRPSDRAGQAAEELVRLVRKTRLCNVPITLGKMPLQPGRGTEISELSRDVVEVYLASASLPDKGGFKLSGEPHKDSGQDKPHTSFAPRGNKTPVSHVDVRCYAAPGEGLVNLGYHFVRRPSRVLWYRRGVLCAESYLEKKLPLQLDIHITGDHLDADNSGLKVTLPDWVQFARLRPILELPRILAVTRLKLEEYWDETPTNATPKLSTFVGMIGGPALVLIFGTVLGPALLLKKAILGGILKGSSAVGAAAGYATSDDHLARVRDACFKAMEAFGKEEIA